MAGGTDRSQRTLRWLLICLLSLGLTCADPSASASAHESSHSGQRPELAHSIVLAGLETAAVAPSKTASALHHVRVIDAAFDTGSAWAARTGFVTTQPAKPSGLTGGQSHSAAPRGPPLLGLL